MRERNPSTPRTAPWSYVHGADHLANELAALEPEDIFSTWCHVDHLEQLGEISAEEATCLKHGIFGLMVLWDLEPDDLADVAAL